MNQDLIFSALRLLVAPVLPVPLLPASDTGQKQVPYVIAEWEDSREIILRNHTWEISLALTLRGNAFDWEREAFDSAFSALLDAMQQVNTASVAQLGQPVYLYSCRLQSIDPVETFEDDMSRKATWRLVVQF